MIAMSRGRYTHSGSVPQRFVLHTPPFPLRFVPRPSLPFSTPVLSASALPLHPYSMLHPSILLPLVFLSRHPLPLRLIRTSQVRCAARCPALRSTLFGSTRHRPLTIHEGGCLNTQAHLCARARDTIAPRSIPARFARRRSTRRAPLDSAARSARYIPLGNHRLCILRPTPARVFACTRYPCRPQPSSSLLPSLSRSLPLPLRLLHLLPSSLAGRRAAPNAPISTTWTYARAQARADRLAALRCVATAPTPESGVSFRPSPVFPTCLPRATSVPMSGPHHLLAPSFPPSCIPLHLYTIVSPGVNFRLARAGGMLAVIQSVLRKYLRVSATPNGLPRRMWIGRASVLSKGNITSNWAKIWPTCSYRM
ncbi:hypothetical protein B0H14DRAFT_1202568 [Mycena olivaceomarginata]|nr:hypothetical protein B0H14DRAFT_1202568 [Mycena olivaceomarginata]